MPILKKTTNTIMLPQRTATLAPETDVLVVGGGPAGIGAALGAAEAGAKVVLAERYGFLGGNSTAGLVLTWASYYTSSEHPIERKPNELTLFPTDHGFGKPIISGVLGRVVDRLISGWRRHFAFTPHRIHGAY